jgi:hypothetical protein
MRSKLSKGLLTALLVLGLLLAVIPVVAANSPFAGGDGSPGNPFQIANWHHLNNVRLHLGSHFILMNNLDSTTAGYTDWASSIARGGAGWLPIATFTGNFNGQGREIRDLFINRPAEGNVGLFGVVGIGGVIGNVGVANANVTGWDRTGGLVGRNDGTVNNSYATGSVTATTANIAGGLVGENWGTVNNSYSTGSVATTGGVDCWWSGGIQCRHRHCQ